MRVGVSDVAVPQRRLFDAALLECRVRRQGALLQGNVAPHL